MLPAVVTFCLLLVGHFLADFPWQGEFMATRKNPNHPEGQDIWGWLLLGHSAIHGGFVLLITGSLLLALLETICHAAIDLLKCEGRISFHTDQILHIGCKLIWIVILLIA